jgi:hypothetical protein
VRVLSYLRWRIFDGWPRWKVLPSGLVVLVDRDGRILEMGGEATAFAEAEAE